MAKELLIPIKAPLKYYDLINKLLPDRGAPGASSFINQHAKIIRSLPVDEYGEEVEEDGAVYIIYSTVDYILEVYDNMSAKKQSLVNAMNKDFRARLESHLSAQETFVSIMTLNEATQEEVMQSLTDLQIGMNELEAKYIKEIDDVAREGRIMGRKVPIPLDTWPMS